MVYYLRFSFCIHMPRGESSTPPDMFKEAMDASVDKEVKKKATEQLYYDRFGALVDKIMKRERLTDSKEQQEMDGDIAADVSFLAEKMPTEHEELYERQVTDFKENLKKSTGPEKRYLKRIVSQMEEALERIRGERLVEITEPPSDEHERGVLEGASAEQQETDRIIAEEQRAILDDVDRRLLGAISNPEHKVAETRMISGLRKKLGALRKAYDAGTIPPKDFVTDSALLFADLQEKTDALQQTIQQRAENHQKKNEQLLKKTKQVAEGYPTRVDQLRDENEQLTESREEIAGIFREVKRSQDVVGPEGMATPEARPEDPSEAAQEVRNRIAEARLAPPPENLPVEQPIPLTSRKEASIRLGVRKADAEEIAADTKTTRVDPEYRAEAQAQAAIQEKVNFFLTLDPKGREEMRAAVQSQLDTGKGSLANEGWTREDMYRLNKKIEGMQAKPEQVQRGERERTDRADSPEATRGRLKKQVESMMRETPNAAELMRVHTGSGWETLDAESFANRYLNLLNKDIAYTQAKKQTSFFGKVGNLFGRKGPEAAIMSGAERSEFKQMDAIMEELGIEKSTYSTATPSIR